MQTPEQQAQANQERLKKYQAKLTAAQRTRSSIACAVSDYCGLLGLSLLQKAQAIKTALISLDCGDKELTAYRAGMKTARIIAVTCGHAQDKEQSLFVSH